MRREGARDVDDRMSFSSVVSAGPETIARRQADHGRTEEEAGHVLRVRPAVRHRVHRHTRTAVPGQVDPRER